MSKERIQTILDPNKTSGEVITESAGRRCYMSFEVGLNPNISKIREEIGVYIDNILASGHGSVLEHTSFTFAIENCSRVFTGEMNRHRAGWAISEGSMRFIRFEDIPYWIPTSISPPQEYNEDPKLIEKKEKSRDIMADVYKFVEGKYSELVAVWKDELSPDSKFAIKKDITSMIRRIVPMGVATGGIWTGNLRALRHVLTMRGSSVAEEEIFLVATKMFELMLNAEPSFFKDFEKTGPGKFLVPKHRKV